MPRTIERVVYKFSELSDAAKEVARNARREAGHHDEWWDAVYEDAIECGRLMGIIVGARPIIRPSGIKQERDINFSGFHSQGDGACFRGRVEQVNDPVAAILGHAGQDEELKSIAEGLALLQITARLTCGGSIEGRITTSGNYCHSGTMHCTASYVDVAGEAPQVSDQAEKTVLDLACRFADWIYAQLEAEDEYLNSDECIDEQLTDDEFDEDGVMI